MEAYYLGKIDETIGHWWLIYPLFSLLPRNQGMRLRVTTCHCWLVTLQPSPIPRWFPKVTLINTDLAVLERDMLRVNKRSIGPLWLWSKFRNWEQETQYSDKTCARCFHNSGNSKSRRLGAQEPWAKTKYSWGTYSLYVIISYIQNPMQSFLLGCFESLNRLYKAHFQL